MVESSSPFKKDWVLTQDAFDLLLARLDRDKERAGQQYENIRRGLITFFECRGSAAPQDQADATINRVARKLLEGKQIHIENPAAYFYGVARNVLKEYWDSPGSSLASLDDSPPRTHPSVDPRHLDEQQSDRELEERRLDCLERCLQQLAASDRELIGQYYQGETSVKIQNRKALARTAGIPLNALRIRALRIREKLEDCVTRCLEQPVGPP
jgi:DNA-directed RNA polymerase specialized sigma24 family protein